MDKRRVLFICSQNSACSQIADAWLKRIGGEAFEAEIPGLEAGTVKPLLVEAMREVGVDLSGNGTQSVFESFEAGRRFDYIVTLCDRKKAERCPLFPGSTEQLHGGIPGRPKGPVSDGEQLAHVRGVRGMIKQRVEAWVGENR